MAMLAMPLFATAENFRASLTRGCVLATLRKLVSRGEGDASVSPSFFWVFLKKKGFFLLVAFLML